MNGGDVARLNSNKIPLKSANDPQDNLSVYLPKQKGEGRFLTTVPVQGCPDADVSTLLNEWKNGAPFLVLSFADAHMPDFDFVPESIRKNDLFGLQTPVYLQDNEAPVKEKIEQRYREYLDAVRHFLGENTTKPVLFLISGDGFPKYNEMPGGYLSSFVKFLFSTCKVFFPKAAN